MCVTHEVQKMLLQTYAQVFSEFLFQIPLDYSFATGHKNETDLDQRDRWIFGMYYPANTAS